MIRRLLLIFVHARQRVTSPIAHCEVCKRTKRFLVELVPIILCCILYASYVKLPNVHKGAEDSFTLRPRTLPRSDINELQDSTSLLWDSEYWRTMLVTRGTSAPLWLLCNRGNKTEGLITICIYPSAVPTCILASASPTFRTSRISCARTSLFQLILSHIGRH